MFAGLSYVAWDNDVYYYQRIAMAFDEGNSWAYMNHYAPPLFAWLWGIVGVTHTVTIILLQAVLSVLCLWPISRMCQGVDKKIPLWVALGFVAFQASLMRYGMQPLPDTLFLLLHLCLLAELTSEKVRPVRLMLLLFVLPWVRYDTFIFIAIYFIWALVMGQRNKKVLAAMLIGAVLGLGALSLNSYLRHDSWVLTSRMAALDSPVGEDQLVEGQTLWHILANKGEKAPNYTEEQISQALLDKNARESKNATSTGTLLKNFKELVLWKLWHHEQLNALVLLLVLLGLWRAPKRVWLLTMLAVLSVGVYSFLGPRERYLSFSSPLFLIVAARGMGLMPWKQLMYSVFLCWLLWQLKIGSYHYRHPENQLIEHQLAGKWIARHGKKQGPIMSREGVSSIYAQRQWRRLPTSSDLQELMAYAKKEGVSYFVVGDRYFLKKRPWQGFLLNDFPKSSVKTFTVGKYHAYIYELNN